MVPLLSSCVLKKLSSMLYVLFKEESICENKPIVVSRARRGGGGGGWGGRSLVTLIPFVHKSLQNYNDFVRTVTRLNRDMNNS